jgi:hypothetical protein
MDAMPCTMEEIARPIGTNTARYMAAMRVPTAERTDHRMPPTKERIAEMIDHMTDGERRGEREEDARHREEDNDEHTYG